MNVGFITRSPTMVNSLTKREEKSIDAGREMSGRSHLAKPNGVQISSMRTPRNETHE